MKASFIAVLVMAACWARAESQALQKVASPVTGQARGADKSTQNNSESQQKSPDKAPAFVNVTVANDPQHPAAHPQEKNNQESKWSDPITLFTGLLVLVGAGQIVVYWKQKIVMERALRVSRRPRIFIREMTLNEDSNDEKKLRIDCAVVNGGDATATMLGSFADVQCVKLRDWRPRPVVINMGLNNVLKSGEHFLWAFDVRPGDATRMALAQTRERASASDENSTNLYVRGVLLYKDYMGIQRRTGVWRVLNVSTDRFRKVKGAKAEGYEHAD